jgi:hypothetical protein
MENEIKIGNTQYIGIPKGIGEHVKALKDKLKVAVEALEFYGKKESYEPWTEAYSEYVEYSRDYMCAIDCIQEDDTEKIIESLPLSKKEVSEWYGGKRARIALEKIKAK